MQRVLFYFVLFTGWGAPMHGRGDRSSTRRTDGLVGGHARPRGTCPAGDARCWVYQGFKSVKSAGSKQEGSRRPGFNELPSSQDELGPALLAQALGTSCKCRSTLWHVLAGVGLIQVCGTGSSVVSAGGGHSFVIQRHRESPNRALVTSAASFFPGSWSSATACSRRNRRASF